MGTMPRPRPPHLQRQINRHGKGIWYVRIGKGPRIRVRGEFGTPEFDAEYKAALENNPRPTKGAPSVDSLAWLVARYRETSAWFELSSATRRQRDNIFLHVIETAGDRPYRLVDQAAIASGRERRKGTPAQARNFL